MVRNYKRKTTDRWSKSQLLEALLLMKNKTLSIYEASDMYGIARSTLYRHITKLDKLPEEEWTVERLGACGGSPILTPVEESILEQTLLELLRKGFAVKPADVKRVCYEYCEVNRIGNHFNQEKRMASDDWYYGFLKRHPEFKRRMRGQEKLLDKEINALLLEAKIPLGTRKAKVVPDREGDQVQPSGSGGKRIPVPVLVPPEIGGGDGLKKPLKRLGAAAKTKKPGLKLVLVQAGDQEDSGGQVLEFEDPGRGKEIQEEQDQEEKMAEVEQQQVLEELGQEVLVKMEPAESLEKDEVALEEVILSFDEYGQYFDDGQKMESEKKEESKEDDVEGAEIMEGDLELKEDVKMTESRNENDEEEEYSDSEEEGYSVDDDAEEEEPEDDVDEESVDDDEEEAEDEEK